MFNRFLSRFSQLLAIVAVFGFVGLGSAMAQAEPTMNEVYKAAQAGKLDQAQVMIQQVLIAHPNSAKAHFVQAELFARQGLASKGRESLVTADKLAPGLPFVKPEAVQALRLQLASKPIQSGPAEPQSRDFALNTPTTAKSEVPFGLILLVVAGMIGAVVWLIRRKPAVTPTAYANPPIVGAAGGLNGPQTFGSGMNGVGTMAPGYGQSSAQPGYGPMPYGQPASTGMGGRVMGGLATGLAVGAGVMAAQAIGKNLMGHNEQPAHLSDGAAGNDTGHQTLAGNSDMGGDNFGINDNTSWDDGGSSADVGGGGDWDT